MEQNEKSGKRLEVKDLRVSFFTPAGEVKAVSGISYDLDYDEVMGIVGESGSGKSQEAYSIMGLLQSPGKVIGGSITFEGRDVLAFSKKEMASFRGSEVAMIFQNPMTSLNPVYTIGNQIVEMVRLHTNKDKKEAYARAKELLELVGINNVAKRMKQYPHEFSGGMRQRVMIAMGLICHPKLLIADEPTTALDVTIQAQILELMKELQKKTHMGIIFITLIPIEGTPVDMLNPPEGCPFAPRCEHAMKICLQKMPPYVELGEGHRSACWLRVQDQLDKAGQEKPVQDQEVSGRE